MSGFPLLLPFGSANDLGICQHHEQPCQISVQDYANNNTGLMITIGREPTRPTSSTRTHSSLSHAGSRPFRPSAPQSAESHRDCQPPPTRLRLRRLRRSPASEPTIPSPLVGQIGHVTARPAGGDVIVLLLGAVQWWADSGPTWRRWRHCLRLQPPLRCTPVLQVLRYGGYTD